VKLMHRIAALVVAMAVTTMLALTLTAPPAEAATKFTSIALRSWKDSDRNVLIRTPGNAGYRILKPRSGLKIYFATRRSGIDLWVPAGCELTARSGGSTRGAWSQLTSSDGRWYRTKKFNSWTAWVAPRQLRMYCR
jgi:hypothetical protein